MSIFTYGPLFTWFAWHPVETRGGGWVWLRRVKRQKVYPDIPGLNTCPTWDHYRMDDPRLKGK